MRSIILVLVSVWGLMAVAAVTSSSNNCLGEGGDPNLVCCGSNAVAARDAGSGKVRCVESAVELSNRCRFDSIVKEFRCCPESGGFTKVSWDKYSNNIVCGYDQN